MDETPRGRRISTTDDRGRPGTRLVAAGVAWTVGARWASRGIGLISTIILARLLQPTDFGLVAMGALTVQFVLVFADAGQAMAVIRNVDATEEHFDTAWTMSIVIGVCVSAILLAAAPLAGLYFHEPRAIAVVRVIALKPLINGFTNVGVLQFRKDLRFGKDFQFLTIQRLSTFIVGIALAFALRSYWALVIASVCGEVLSVFASYRLSPYRPRLRLTKLHEIWSYSIWMQCGNIGSFFGEQTDQLVVGGVAGAGSMGLYNVSRDVASAPTEELVVPMARVLFPYYATLQHEPSLLAKAYLDVLSCMGLVALSTGVGVALVADDLVSTVLGQKWAAGAPLIAWLAVGSGILGVSRSANAVVIATGGGRLFALRSWFFVMLFAPAALIGGLNWGAIGVAVSRTLVTLLFAPVMFYTAMKVTEITAKDIMGRLWRPVLAASAMAAAVKLSGLNAAVPPGPIRLICDVGVGSVTFSATILLLWVLANRPAGAEHIIVRQLTKVARRGRSVAGAALLRRSGNQ
jgi:O-antigen/teichoic acid export membrane protein